MNARLRALLAKKQAKIDAAKALTAAAGENELSTDDQAKFDALMDEANALQASIDRERALIEAERSQPGLPAPAGGRQPHITVDENIEQDPRRGFAHMGQFARAVLNASTGAGAHDQRLMTLSAAAASTYGNESSGADGGFLVPPEYAAGILSVIESPENLLSRCRQIPISGTTMSFPKNETTEHGTTGIQAYWDDEADTITQSKAAFKLSTARVHRITALVPMTEELLEDSPAAGAWVEMEAGEKMAFKVSDAILNGLGAGSPLGVMNAPCLVTVSKESSQAADSLLAQNILKMKSRMPARNYSRAVWVMHSDVELLLPGLFIPIKNVAGTEEDIPADLIVSAIGQAVDFTGLEALDSGRGAVTADKNYQVQTKVDGQTRTQEGMFCGGDILRPHLLTTAIGHGAIAADGIDRFLRSEALDKRPKIDVHTWDIQRKLVEKGLKVEPVTEPLRGTDSSNGAIHNFDNRSDRYVIPHSELFLGHFGYTPRQRRKVTTLTAAEALNNFEERLLPLLEAQAQAEAKRCMSCGLCFECDNCVVYCPQTAVFKVKKSQSTTGRYVDTDYDKCIGCHICADVCPTGYIQMGLGE